MFDCIVAGAGPAGASAAYHLAKRGRSVLLVEKQSLPRYKPCAGGVSPAVAQWFDFDFSPAIAQRVETIGYTWKLEDPVQARLENLEPMWMVQRDIFDHFLVQQAQKQGAELRDNTAVTGIEFKGDRWQVNTANGLVEGRYLIAADGAEGPMSKWLGFKEPKRRMGAILEVSTPGVAQTDARFEFGMVKNGYLSSFPKGEGCSIAAATFRGGDASDLQTSLKDYAAQSGFNVANCKTFTHSLCLWDGNQKLHTQNALLAGEAACVVDPLLAEGIRPSMFTGVKAAEAIDQALAGNSSALETYSKIVSDEWGADMVWAQRIAGAFYRFPGLGYKQGIKRPAATSYFARILCGQMRYSDIANTAIKRLSGGLIPGMG
ncbi:MAG: geranylgeranyl reductase family protein [Oscillatoriales cyanobacterium C42_A2020_001]|nr:geranylgeranyl reductase family protein [Leptolyngbyaceae cyanobacterium C42_A2020_001]